MAMRVPVGLRGTVETAARGLGLLGALERRMCRGLTVLMYHRVLPDADCRDYPFPSLVMPESYFRAQMAWLAERCEPLPLGDALERLERGGPCRRPLVSVTFDDGYADNGDLAAPIAEEHGVRCTFFVATNFVEHGRPLWFDRARAVLARAPRASMLDAWCQRVGAAPAPDGPDGDAWIEGLKHVRPAARDRFLDALDERFEVVPVGRSRAPIDRRTAPMDMRAAPGDRRAAPGDRRVAQMDRRAAPGGRLDGPMSPATLRALSRKGHEIASHGTRHSVLSVLSETELEQELYGSRLRLEEWLGVAPSGLAYPDGGYDARVISAARRAGYRWACTTDRGLHCAGDEPMTVPRRAVTAAAVGDGRGRYLPLAFRSELCGLRDAWRRLRSV